MKRFVGSVILSVFLLVISTALHAESFSAPASEQPDYLNAVKITFLSWITGSTKVSYERAFPKIRQSGELCGSLICAGYDRYNNDPLGFTVRYGHKFFLPDKDGLSLKGFYLRPELTYSHYYYDSAFGHGRTLANMGTLMGTIGYQYVYRRFLADVWVGGGYALGTPAETGYHHGFKLWNWFGTYNPNIAMSFSVRLGICF